MASQSYARPALLDSVKLGAILGAGAAWAIFGLILAAGAQLGLPPGTFYEMVGVSLGQSEEWPAIYLGFVLHMITGMIIGIVYMIVSDRVRQFRSFSTVRWFGTGLTTGIVVWAALFVPLHFFLVQPTLQGMLLTSADLRAERLNEMSDSILYGALAMHLVFGSILGFFARIATSSRDIVEKKGGGVRQYDAAA
jgi:hypothetical protein